MDEESGPSKRQWVVGSQSSSPSKQLYESKNHWKQESNVGFIQKFRMTLQQADSYTSQLWQKIATRALTSEGSKMNRTTE